MKTDKVLKDVNNAITKYVADKMRSNLGSESNAAISLRLPSALDNLLDELSITLNKPKTELLLWFIISGAKALEKEVEIMATEQQEILEEDKSVSSRFFMLNTNFTNDRGTHFEMLKNHEAAAFCDSHKHVIKRLKEGDIVYLYQSTRGVVARGVVKGGLKKSSHEGIDNAKYSVDLAEFDSGFTPVTAKQFKKLSKKDANFRMTLVRLDDDQHKALDKEINSRIGK